jgi:hypothetical protein
MFAGPRLSVSATCASLTGMTTLVFKLIHDRPVMVFDPLLLCMRRFNTNDSMLRCH